MYSSNWEKDRKASYIIFVLRTPLILLADVKISVIISVLSLYFIYDNYIVKMTISSFFTSLHISHTQIKITTLVIGKYLGISELFEGESTLRTRSFILK